jgi:hypothetical protein
MKTCNLFFFILRSKSCIWFIWPNHPSIKRILYTNNFINLPVTNILLINSPKSITSLDSILNYIKIRIIKSKIRVLAICLMGLILIVFRSYRPIYCKLVLLPILRIIINTFFKLCYFSVFDLIFYSPLANSPFHNSWKKILLWYSVYIFPIASCSFACTPSAIYIFRAAFKWPITQVIFCTVGHNAASLYQLILVWVWSCLYFCHMFIVLYSSYA